MAKMNLPECPNVKAGVCARSNVRYGGELKNQSADILICVTCNLLWMITRPNTRRRAAYLNTIEKLERATAHEQARAQRKLFFDYGRAS